MSSPIKQKFQNKSGINLWIVIFQVNPLFVTNAKNNSDKQIFWNISLKYLAQENESRDLESDIKSISSTMQVIEWNYSKL